MDNLTTSRLYARVGEKLNVIPGAVSLHLDEPLVQMVVHGVLTDCNAPRGVAILHHPSDIQKTDNHNQPGTDNNNHQTSFWK